ncbi:MAG: hypothetical protein ABIM43_07850 [candidate division WOR-3 bacterium]
MKLLIYILVMSFMIGIATPYGEVYVRDYKELCDTTPSCDMGDMNSHCNKKADNKLPLCPLCPSFYSFNPYLPNGGEIFFTPQVSSLISVPLETLRDQGFVASIFHPPTLIL